VDPWARWCFLIREEHVEVVDTGRKPATGMKPDDAREVAQPRVHRVGIVVEVDDDQRVAGERAGALAGLIEEERSELAGPPSPPAT
jgi:hypothetical protein